MTTNEMIEFKIIGEAEEYCDKSVRQPEQRPNAVDWDEIKKALHLSENYMTLNGPVEGSYALRMVRAALVIAKQIDEAVAR